MSSTNRGGNRDEFDDYPTPVSAIDAFLEAAPPALLQAGRWLEPCAGEGRIIERVNARLGSKWWQSWEIQEKYRLPLSRLESYPVIGDCLSIAAAQPGPTNLGYAYSVAISNPPYNQAMPILLALRRIAHTVALLLPRNFIGSRKRAEYLRDNMPDEYLLPNRPSFVWRHKYELACAVCGRYVTRKVDVPAGQRALQRKDPWPVEEHCGPGSLRVARVTTTRSDSCEYCFCVWTPDSGPVGSTRMLALTPKAERC